MEAVLALVFLGLFLMWSLGKRRRRRRKSHYRSTPARRYRHTFSKGAIPKLPSGLAEVQGTAYVVDGDTVVIQSIHVRLFGIDTPELDHPYGNNAKWALISLCRGHVVRAEVVAEDDHGRTVARCYLDDGRDLSAEMVKLGLAIDWPKFSGGQYRSLEVPDIRKKLWLADARQKGRMHVWERYNGRGFNRTNTD